MSDGLMVSVTSKLGSVRGRRAGRRRDGDAGQRVSVPVADRDVAVVDDITTSVVMDDAGEGLSPCCVICGAEARVFVLYGYRKGQRIEQAYCADCAQCGNGRGTRGKRRIGWRAGVLACVGVGALLAWMRT